MLSSGCGPGWSWRSPPGATASDRPPKKSPCPPTRAHITLAKVEGRAAEITPRENLFYKRLARPRTSEKKKKKKKKPWSGLSHKVRLWPEDGSSRSSCTAPFGQTGAQTLGNWKSEKQRLWKTTSGSGSAVAMGLLLPFNPKP